MTQAADHPTQSLSPLPRPLPDEPLTHEEFLDWCDEDTLAEWVDGRIEVTSPADLGHQQLIGWLYRVIIEIAEENGGAVILPLFQMKLPEPARSGREPDLLYLTAARRSRLRPTYLDGPADLVIEVTSPESRSRDHGDKYIEYEAAGVPEYWLIDLPRNWLRVFRLGDDGRYRTVFEGASGEYTTDQLSGLAFRAEWFWQDPLPPVGAARRTTDHLDA